MSRSADMAVVPSALCTFVDSIAAHETGTCSCPGDERGCFQTIIADWRALTSAPSKSSDGDETLVDSDRRPTRQSINTARLYLQGVVDSFDAKNDNNDYDADTYAQFAHDRAKQCLALLATLPAHRTNDARPDLLGVALSTIEAFKPLVVAARALLAHSDAGFGNHRVSSMRIQALADALSGIPEVKP